MLLVDAVHRTQEAACGPNTCSPNRRRASSAGQAAGFFLPSGCSFPKTCGGRALLGTRSVSVLPVLSLLLFFHVSLHPAYGCMPLSLILAAAPPTLVQPAQPAADGRCSPGGSCRRGCAKSLRFGRLAACKTRVVSAQRDRRS